VRFDPTRDDVTRLEVVENGILLHSAPRRRGESEIACRFEHEVRGSVWLALRAQGRKVGENHAWVTRYDTRYVRSPSLAHTAPVYVSVEGTDPIESPALTRAWIARLEDLEARLAEDRLGDLASWPEASDGVELETLRAGRAALLEAIAESRRLYRDRLE
jgi:hypothetical protein